MTFLFWSKHNSNKSAHTKQFWTINYFFSLKDFSFIAHFIEKQTKCFVSSKIKWEMFELTIKSLPFDCRLIEVWDIPEISIETRDTKHF